MEFTVKIKASDSLRQRDIIKDLQDGIALIVGGGDPDDRYLQKLSQTKVGKVVKVVKTQRQLKIHQGN